jgi:hypothetical protein
MGENHQWLHFHWQGSKGDALEKDHFIDAKTLTEAVSNFQEILYQIGMDIDGRSPSSRARVPCEYHERCALLLKPAEKGGYAIAAEVGAKSDVTRNGFIPQVLEKTERFLRILASGNTAETSVNDINELFPNNAIKRRIVRLSLGLIPAEGSERTLTLEMTNCPALILTEKNACQDGKYHQCLCCSSGTHPEHHNWPVVRDGFCAAYV